jgi:hypothetical protein
MKYSQSDLESYAVSVVDNSVTPTPVIGTDLVPVLTVTNALSNTVECVPELAWTDSNSWGTKYFNAVDTGKMAGLITYPGPGYYRIPATYGVTYVFPDSTSFTPVSTSVRFESNYTGKTISIDQTSVPGVANGVFVTTPVAANLTDEFFVAFLMRLNLQATPRNVPTSNSIGPTTSTQFPAQTQTPIMRPRL